MLSQPNRVRLTSVIFIAASREWRRIRSGSRAVLQALLSARQGSDRPAVAVVYHRYCEQLVDRLAVGGKRYDAGLDDPVLGVARPQRDAAAPGRLAGLGHKAQPLARLRVGDQLGVDLVEPGAGDLAAERAHHLGAAEAIA